MTIDREKIMNPNRFFNYNTLIGDLRGKSFEEIVNQFEKRIKGWYIDIVDKLKDLENSGFVRMAITNILIDTLSQYFNGTCKGTGEDFANFLKTYIPEFAQPLKNKGFLFYLHKDTKKKIPTSTSTYADVFFNAFRCGLLHQSVIKGYGRASKAEKMVNDFKWDEENDNVEIKVDSDQLFDRIKEIFNKYIQDLKNPSNIDLRKKFKRKILYDFGYEIPL